MKIKTTEVKILGIICSPRRGGNTEALVNAALEGALQVSGVVIDKFSFTGKKIADCTGCFKCREIHDCVQKDDLQKLRELWHEADGILWGAPVYHLSIPGKVKSAIDRLGQIEFAIHKRRPPRFLKVCGGIVQGTSRFGGQELALNFLLHSFLMLNCLPVTGDKPGSFIGVAGHSPSSERGSIKKDTAILDIAKNLGQRLAETAKIVKAGRLALRDELPPEYLTDSWRK
jgi:multimeric flavodoxin WrbA